MAPPRRYETAAERLAAIRMAFAEVEDSDRLALLLEFGERAGADALLSAPDSDAWERVSECRTPVYLIVGGNTDAVSLRIAAPSTAPTTRAFAAMLIAAVDGSDAPGVQAIPDDLPRTLGLERWISPLRLEGMTGMIRRMKRQARDALG